MRVLAYETLITQGEPYFIFKQERERERNFRGVAREMSELSKSF